MPRQRLSQLSKWFRRRRQAQEPADRRYRSLQLEALEDRMLLAVRVWEGGGLTQNWSDAANWVGDVAPLTNDELVFAAGAAQLANLNDLPAGSAVTGDGHLTLTSAAANVLNITGGSIDTGLGILTLSGNINAGSAVLPSLIAGNLDLGGATRTITVADNGSMVDDLAIAATISGASAGIVKAGAGTLALGGVNTFDGGVMMTGAVGSIRLGSSSAGPGMFGPLGTGMLTVTFTANSQTTLLEAMGQSRTIHNPIVVTGNFTGTNFGVTGFNGLVLGDLGGIEWSQNRNFNVVNAGVMATVAGPITQDATNRNFTKIGRGTLVLQGNNTYLGNTVVGNTGGVLVLEGTSAGTGATTVGEFATLLLRENGQLNSASGNVTVNSGGTLQIDNTAVDNTDRLPTVTHTLNFGRIEFQAHAAGSSEAIGALSVQADLDSSVHLVNVGGGASTFTAASFSFGGGSALLFRGTGQEFGGGMNDFVFTAAPGLTGGILSRTRIVDASGLDFATHAGAGTPITAAPFNSDINAGGNVKLTGALGEITALAGSVSINALLMAGGTDITEVGGPHVLTVTSGFVGVEDGDSTISVGTLNFAGARSVFVVNGLLTADAVVNSTNTESFGKTGLGTMFLEQANTFTGRARITQGGLVVRNDGALGTATGATATETLISNRAFLLLDGPRTIGDERITITGTGFYNDQSGALRAAGGVSTIGIGTTIFNRGNASFIGVDAGSGLIVSGELQGGGNALTKVGEGSLEFAGSAANTYTGTTNVNQGTLRLNKSGGVDAIRGSLVIGDGLGGDDADQVLLLAPEQIRDTSSATVTVQSSGRFNLQGNSETLGSTGTALAVNTGAGYSGDVALGAATLTLVGLGAAGVGGNVTSGQNFGAATTASPSATISGGLIDAGLVNRQFNIGDSGPVRELEISSAITGASIQKTGTGGLALLADNAAAGLSAFILNAGTIIVGHNGALGAGTLTNSAGATIQGDDDVTLRTIANPIAFTNTGTAGTTLTVGNFQGLAPLTFTGPITNPGGQNRTFTLQNSATEFSGNLDNNARAVTFNAVGSITTPAGNTTTVSGQLQNLTALTKSGGGTLISTNANATTGVTSVTGGILRITNSGGLGVADGTAATRTNVSANASLELENVAIGDELLVISATTAYLDGDELAIPGTQILRGIGSLRNIGGASTWGTGATSLFLASNPSDIHVSGGTLLTLDMNLIGTGTLTSTTGGNGLVKLGDGELVLAGTVANNFTGQTSVLEGTLTLNKNAGDNALGGTLLVGDGVGTDTVRWNASEQLPNVTIIANQSAVLNLNGQTETVTTSPIFGIGPNASASLIGGGQLGAASVFVAVDSRATAGAAPVMISADYNFGAVAANTNREFRIPDSPAAEELVLDGAILGSFATGGRGLIKSGQGTLRFTGASPNAFASGTTGVTNVTVGTLVLDKGDGILALPGTLIVGNGVGEQDADRVVSLFDDQIAGVNTTTINASGLLDLTGVNNTIGTTTMVAGLKAGGHVVTGAGALITTNTITVNAAGTGETSARIEGNLDLGGGAPRTFTVNTRQVALDTPDEFQVLDLAGATGGTFTLSFRGHTTAPIAFNAPATGGGSVEALLRALQSITGTNVTVQNPAPGTYYSFFRDGLGKIDVDEITIDASLLTGTVGTPAVTTRHDGSETIELDVPALVTNGNLSKGGAGAIRLSNANTYTNTALTAGFLLLGSDSDPGLAFGPVGAGTVTISGTSELRADGGHRTLHNPVALSGTLQFTGTNWITLDSAAPIQLTANRTFFVAENGMTATIESEISQSGARALTKTGAGTLLLNAVNTYTGTTNVAAGTLGGTGAVAALVIDSNSTAAPFTNPSNLSPGVSPGVFSSGNATFNADSSFSVELNGPVGPGAPVAGVDYDQLNVTGIVNLGAGVSDLILNVGPSFSPAADSRFTIINNNLADAVTGFFAGLPDDTVFSLAGRMFRIDYDVDGATGLVSRWRRST
jgi:autotransporter-associated beta strand protein